MLALLLGACNDDSDKPTFVPESGNWLYMELDVTTNTCMISGAPPPVPTIFVLSYGGGDSFQAEIDEDLPPVTCQITETEFECTELVEDLVVTGVDNTVITRRTTWQGGFNSETELVGVAESRMTCEGDYCEPTGVPCTKRSTFEAEAL